MRIRSIKPEFYRSGELDPSDRQAWKTLGDSGPGFEFLYRLYDADHGLLYVGITWNPYVRWVAHSKSKTWWLDVAHFQLWRCTDDDARHWETRCIKEQHPRHNIHQAVAR